MPALIKDFQAVEKPPPGELVAAVRARNKELVLELLERGADPNDDEKGCALIHAACKGLPEIARLLIKHGADINKTDSFGATPLMYAAHDSVEVLRVLLDAGAALQIKADFIYKTALDWAKSPNGCEEAVQLLEAAPAR